MAAILPEAFAIGLPCNLAALARPTLHRIQIIVGAVVAAKPLTLARVFGEHGAFTLERSTNIYNKFRVHDAAVAIASFERIHVIEVRDSIQHRRRPLASGAVVRNGCAETRIANQGAGGFVIAEIIDRRGSHDQLRPYLP